MIDSDNYLNHIDLAYQQISSLSSGEIKYYLYLLVTAIKDKNNLQTQQFLTQLFSLLETLKSLHNLKSFDEPEFNDLFKKVREHYTALGKLAETNQFSAELKVYLLNAAGATLALVFGLMGGIIGGLFGLARGIWNYHPFRGPVVGIFAGMLMGAILGYRLPKKLFKDEMQRQLKFGLDGADSCFNEMQKEVLSKSKVRPIFEYRDEVEAEIRALFESEEEYKQFLDSKVNYLINTLAATFIGDPMLAGYVGHHTYIKINIKAAQYLVEFAPEPSNLSNPPTQSEQRTVEGRKLIEVLAYHRKLQETHTCDANYILTKAKPGDTDCLSYVDKVLIGTNQPATKVTRYVNLNRVGTFYSGCLEKLSPFEAGFFRKGKVVEEKEDLSKGVADTL